MEDVCRAIRVISSGTALPDHIAAANSFLMAFSETPAAWHICLDLLSNTNDIDLNTRRLASHLLHAKIERDAIKLSAEQRSELQAKLADIVRIWCKVQRTAPSLDVFVIRVSQCISRLALHSMALQTLLRTMLESLRFDSDAHLAALLILYVTLDAIHSSATVSYTDRIEIRDLLLTRNNALIRVLGETLRSVPSAVQVALQCISQLQSPEIRFFSTLSRLQPLIAPLFQALFDTKSPLILDIISTSLAAVNDEDAALVQDLLAQGLKTFPPLISNKSLDQLNYAVIRVATSVPCVYLFRTGSPVSLQWIEWVVNLTSISYAYADVCVEFWIDALTVGDECAEVHADKSVFYAVADLMLKHCTTCHEDTADDAEERQALRSHCSDLWIQSYYCLGVKLLESRLHSILSNQHSSWRSIELASSIVATLAPIINEADDLASHPQLFLSLVASLNNQLRSDQTAVVLVAARALGNFAFVVVSEKSSPDLLCRSLSTLLDAMLRTQSKDVADQIVNAFWKVVDQCEASLMQSIFGLELAQELVQRVWDCTAAVLQSSVSQSALTRRLISAFGTFLSRGNQPLLLDGLVSQIVTRLLLSPNAFFALAGVLDSNPDNAIQIGKAVAELLQSRQLPDNNLDGFGFVAPVVLSAFANANDTSQAAFVILDMLARAALDSVECGRGLALAATDLLKVGAFRERIVSDYQELTSRVYSVTNMSIVLSYVDLGAQLSAQCPLDTIPTSLFDLTLSLLCKEYAHDREVVLSALAVWNNILGRGTAASNVVGRYLGNLARLLLSGITSWSPRNHIPHLTETLQALAVQAPGGLALTADFIAGLPSDRKLERDAVDLFLNCFARLSGIPSQRRRFIAMMQDFSDVCHSTTGSNIEVLVGYQL